MAAMPSTSWGISAGASTSPVHWPYWVWLENCTVCSGQTLTPRRAMGKVAALLPAWPKTTWDWMASRWGVRFIDGVLGGKASQYRANRPRRKRGAGCGKLGAPVSEPARVPCLAHPDPVRLRGRRLALARPRRAGAGRAAGEAALRPSPAATARRHRRPAGPEVAARRLRPAPAG